MGVVPFFAYAAMFLILPAATVLAGAFKGEHGGYTLDNVRVIVQTADIRAAYWESIRISLTTALLGALFGLLIAYAAIRKGTPELGPLGVRHLLRGGRQLRRHPARLRLHRHARDDRDRHAVSRQRLRRQHLPARLCDLVAEGVELVYLYFQIPLMILVIAPAIDGLRAEWSEASSNLGASRWQYWRHIGMPVLMPSLLGAVILLFGNSFAAYATAYSLTSGTGLPLVPILIGNDLTGNVYSNPHEGQALAFGMFVVLAAMMLFYIPLQRRASRWAK